MRTVTMICIIDCSGTRAVDISTKRVPHRCLYGYVRTRSRYCCKYSGTSIIYLAHESYSYVVRGTESNFQEHQYCCCSNSRAAVSE